MERDEGRKEARDGEVDLRRRRRGGQTSSCECVCAREKAKRNTQDKRGHPGRGKILVYHGSGFTEVISE